VTVETRLASVYHTRASTQNTSSIGREISAFQHGPECISLCMPRYVHSHNTLQTVMKRIHGIRSYSTPRMCIIATEDEEEEINASAAAAADDDDDDNIT